jgi:hypothetical protein
MIVGAQLIYQSSVKNLKAPAPFRLVPIYSNPIMFAKDFSNKIFSPPDTKFNYE